MSLGDTLRLLRAKRGGITPWEIEAAANLPKGLYRQMEQRYRPVGDEAAIRAVADYYGVPFETFWRQSTWSRKAFSQALVAARDSGTPLTLHLWNGETVTGQVRWWDLGAVGLATTDGALLVVQRHATERWESRAGGRNEPANPEGR